MLAKKPMAVIGTCLLLVSGCLWSAKNDPVKAGACGLPAREKAKIEPSRSNLPDTENPALFLLPGKVYPIPGFADILDRSIKNNPNDNVLLYIHGRGNEPSKAIKDGILQGLVTEYQVIPIMFTWASGKATFPDQYARRAGSALKQVLNSLREYKAQHRSTLANKKFTLLTHSMGSFVLEGFLKDYPKMGLPRDLFDNTIINAAASQVDYHADWVEKIDFARKVFITYGSEDPALAIISPIPGTARLGKHGARQHGKKERLAQNAIYVDFSQATSDHRYFVGNGDQACIYQFFNHTINGNAPDFSNPQFVTVSIPGKDYLINK